MQQVESVKEFLLRRLREAGASRFEAMAVESGVAASFMRKFVYGNRHDPHISTIQPLLDYFRQIDEGVRELPKPFSVRAADVSQSSAEREEA